MTSPPRLPRTSRCALFRPGAKAAQLLLQEASRSGEPEAVFERFPGPFRALAAEPGSPGRDRLARLIRYTLDISEVPAAALADLLGRALGPAGPEIAMTTAERLRAEGRQEGAPGGLQQGRAALLGRLLAKRFGPLDAGAIDRLRGSTDEALERYADRLLTAATLADVFADPSDATG